MISPFELADSASSPAPALASLWTPADLERIAPLEFLSLEGEEQAEAAQSAEAQEADQAAHAHARAEELRTMLDAAREQAVASAHAAWESQLAVRLAAERARAESAANAFARDRQRYFETAESQVVRLALAVARRILYREIEADPLHLTATVRAALTRVQDESQSTLRVPATEAPLWEQLFNSEPESHVRVVGDSAFHSGECALETSIGRIELGVEVQLEEVERGFNELLRRHAE